MIAHRHKLVFNVLLAIIFFIASMILLQPYTGGDQQWYRNFYQRLAGASLSEVPILQALTTGSAEPIYGYLMWVGANIGVDKDVYISLFNVILLLLISIFLDKNKCNFLFAFLALTNFYVIVLLTSAERLKFSYLIMFYALVVSPGAIKRLFIIIAPLAHFQTVLLYFFLAAGRLSRIRVKLKVQRKKFLISLVALPLIIIAVIVILIKYSPLILGKINYYLAYFSFTNASNVLLLLVVSLFVLSNRLEVVISLSFAGAAAILLSGDRVNMISVFLFLYYCVSQRRTAHPLVIAIMVYFSIKSIGFVVRVFETGSGF